jgi:KaiC/GvpD/RAD55 family RecA-like ATPase
MREFFQGFTLVYGPPGSGKTSLALYAAAQIGERIMYVGFLNQVARCWIISKKKEV